MRKRICALCMCILLVCSFAVVSADELSVVNIADGIAMSSVDYGTEGTDITVTLTAKRLEETDSSDVLVFIASLYDDGIMIDMDTDAKALGTEDTDYTATLELPEDVSKCVITAAILKKTETGLVPVTSASYYPGDENFLPLKSATLSGKELEFDEDNTVKYVVAPKATEYPTDLTVQAADAGTKVDWTVNNDDAQGVITATLPGGEAIEYVVNFENATHYLKLAQTDDDFTDENTWSDWNMRSKDVVMNSYTEYKPSNMPNTYGDKKDDCGKDYGMVNFADSLGKVYTNLHGIDPDQPEKGGSRLFTNYPANYRQRHAIDYVDPYYEGCDYIITSNGAMTTDQSVIYYDFDLAYDAEISILTLSKCNNYKTEGYTEKYNKNSFAQGHYINLTYTNPLINNFGVSPLWDEMLAFQSKANGKLATSDEYAEACEELAASISERTGKEITGQMLIDAKMGRNEKDATDLKIGSGAGGTFSYTNAYVKEFKVAEGEDSVNVKIKAPDVAQGRGFIVVIKPIEE